MLTTPELYVWAAVAVTATAWQQSSFQGGLASGIAARHDDRRACRRVGTRHLRAWRDAASGDSGWIALVAAVIAMVVATAALARGEADSGVDGLSAVVPGS